jgi:hypothetical protein
LLHFSLSSYGVNSFTPPVANSKVVAVAAGGDVGGGCDDEHDNTVKITEFA